MKPKRLFLNRKHIIDMLGDREFYHACPDFLLLRNVARTTLVAYAKSAETNCCGPRFPVIKPVVDAFFDKVEELAAIDVAALEGFRRYWAVKKGSAIGKIVLYYRVSKEPRPRRFEF